MATDALFGDHDAGSLGLSLKKSFLYRAQAIFYGRLTLYGMYFLLWILAISQQTALSTPTINLGLMVSAVIIAVICYRFKAHKSLGRWLHFVTLILDCGIHLWLCQSSDFILSPLMVIHPFLSAAFLLLFHNPVLMIVPLAELPLATLFYFITEGQKDVSLVLSSLIVYGGLDMLAVFFIHLAHSKEHRLLRSMVSLEKKLKELAILKERQRISREFHDGVGAQLISIAMQCDYVQLKGEHTFHHIAEIKDCALESIDDMRRSIAFLEGEFDIEEQIELMLLNFERRHGMSITRNGLNSLNMLTIEQQIACCRIINEALTNALKHGHASLVRLTVQHVAETVGITINDNGQGFDTNAEKKHHYGLKNMTSRAHHMGAHITFLSKPYEGTTISLEIPAGYVKP